MEDIKNYTVFYTEKFGEYLCQCSGIISLSMGDKFKCNKGDMYEIVWKIYNVPRMIMIYHGRRILEG